MLLARSYAIVAFSVAGLMALLYMTGAIANVATVMLGFAISVLLAVYVLAIYPIMESLKDGTGRLKHR